MSPFTPTTSSPLPRSGTLSDLGLDGGDNMFLEEGSNNLTSGLVINPNTCTFQMGLKIIIGFSFLLLLAMPSYYNGNQKSHTYVTLFSFTECENDTSPNPPMCPYFHVQLTVS